MQKKRFSRYFSLFLVCLVLILTFPPITAHAEEVTVTDDAEAIYFVHLGRDDVLFSKNESGICYAASTGKILAGLILCEYFENRLNEPVEITNDMISDSAGYRLGLKVGDTLWVEDLLYAALCGSYNDAYDALACYLMGTKEIFVTEMNARAAALGATATKFSDVSGIDDNSKTTAVDLAKIASAAYQNPLYMTVCDAKQYTIVNSNESLNKTIRNRNDLVFQHSKCHGMNAGETARGGKCVITVAKYGEETFLCIILGVPSEKDQYALAKSLVNQIPKNYSSLTVLTPETALGYVPVEHSDLKNEIRLCVKESLTCYLPIGAEIGRDITYSIRLDAPILQAPITPDTQVGHVAVIYKGKTIGTLPLYTAEGAEYSFFVAMMDGISDTLTGRVFLSGAIFFVVGLTAWIVAECVIARRKRHKWDKYFSEKMNPKPNVSFNRRPRRR